jgi:hypothetical protein
LEQEEAVEIAYLFFNIESDDVKVELLVVKGKWEVLKLRWCESIVDDTQAIIPSCSGS